WRTLVPVLLALGLALVVPYALALSAPTGAGWEETLRLRPVDRARGITSGLLVAALLAHLVSLWRDRHLFRERRSRDFSDYLAVGGVSTLVAGAVGSLAVWLAGATMVVAAIVLRVTGRRPGTPPDRLLRETWVSLAVLGAATGWGLGELPQSRAGWELGFGAPGLDDRAAELGLPWVETASVVSLNLLALVAVALLWRHRTAAQSRSLPLVL